MMMFDLVNCVIYIIIYTISLTYVHMYLLFEYAGSTESQCFTAYYIKL